MMQRYDRETRMRINSIIRDRYAEGKTNKEIAQVLRVDGIRRPNGGKVDDVFVAGRAYLMGLTKAGAAHKRRMKRPGKTKYTRRVAKPPVASTTTNGRSHLVRSILKTNDMSDSDKLALIDLVT